MCFLAWLTDFYKIFSPPRISYDFLNFSSCYKHFLHTLITDNCYNRFYLRTYSEKAMAPQSSTLAWKIPWTEEPGRLQSMGLRRVGHNWATPLSLFTFMHCWRKWQPTPVFLPGGSQGRGSLVGCRLWSRTESDTTEVTQQQQQKVEFRPLIFSLFFF